MIYNLFEKLLHFGVLPRRAVKNDRAALRNLLKQQFVRKVFKKGYVFYELTEKSLPLLEEQRQVLLHKAALLLQVAPHAKFYRALTEDLRWLDEKHPLAPAFRLLGDWQLTRPVVPGQLELAKLRYYDKQGLA